MRLPKFQDTRIHYRRKIWGQSKNVAYYNSEQQAWYYKMTSKSNQAGAPLSTDNRHADDWVQIGASIKGFIKGDLVSVSYISTHDQLHVQRHDILHRKFYVQEITEVKHPEMREYKGASPWFKAILFTTEGKNTRYTFEYVQLKMEQARVRDSIPGEEPNAITMTSVVYGDISAMNAKIKQIQHDKTGGNSIKTAKKGDIVTFLQGPNGPGRNDSSGFTIGTHYVCRRDYSPEGYTKSVTPEGQTLPGTIQVVKDSNDKENGWAAAFFRIHRRAS